MISTSTTATPMRDIQMWIRSLNLDHIHIYQDFGLDTFTINYSVTNRSKQITRYELEDARDPYQIILEAIGQVMALPLDKLREILNPKANPLPNPSISHSDGIYDYATDGSVIGSTQWVSDSTVVITTGAGGSGGIGHPSAVGSTLPTLGQWMTNPNGSVTRQGFVDDILGIDYKHEQMARNALFTDAEQAEIRNMKYVLKNNYLKFVPEKLMYNEKVVVAGGCFASFLSKELPHDIDVFILDDAKTKQYVKEYVDDMNISKPGLFKIGSTNYMNNDKIEFTAFDMNHKNQFVTTSYTTRAELIAHFDMVHCCISYTPYNDKLYITREVFDVIKNTQIRSNQCGIMELVAPWRIEKMKERGWKIWKA
jgi:hypothetical protein